MKLGNVYTGFIVAFKRSHVAVLDRGWRSDVCDRGDIVLRIYVIELLQELRRFLILCGGLLKPDFKNKRLNFISTIRAFVERHLPQLLGKTFAEEFVFVLLVGRTSSIDLSHSRHEFFMVRAVSLHDVQKLGSELGIPVFL